MTFDQRVADAIEVIEFVRRHLGADKVVLAESMGTLTGLPLAKRRPDLWLPWWPLTCTSIWPPTRPASGS
jgi:hypothetical protein